MARALTQQEKLELTAQRIKSLNRDLGAVQTQSDEVIYLIQDIQKRLDQCLRFDAVLANEMPATV